MEQVLSSSDDDEFTTASGTISISTSTGTTTTAAPDPAVTATQPDTSISTSLATTPGTNAPSQQAGSSGEKTRVYDYGSRTDIETDAPEVPSLFPTSTAATTTTAQAARKPFFRKQSPAKATAAYKYKDDLPLINYDGRPPIPQRPAVVMNLVGHMADAKQAESLAPPVLDDLSLRVSPAEPNGKTAAHNTVSAQDSDHYLLDFVPKLKDIAATKPNGRAADSMSDGFIRNPQVRQALATVLKSQDIADDFTDAQVLSLLEEGNRQESLRSKKGTDKMVVSRLNTDKLQLQLQWSDLAQAASVAGADRAALYRFVEGMDAGVLRTLFKVDLLSGDVFQLAKETAASSRTIDEGLHNCFLCLRALLMEQPDDLPYTRFTKGKKSIHHRRTKAQRMTFRPFLYTPYTIQFLRMTTALPRDSRIKLMLCVLYNLGKMMDTLQSQQAKLDEAVFARESNALQIMYASTKNIVYELAFRQNQNDGNNTKNTKADASLIDDMYRSIILVLYMSASVLQELYAEMQLVATTPGVLTGVTLYGVYVSAIMMYNQRWRDQVATASRKPKYVIGTYPDAVTQDDMQATVKDIYNAVKSLL